MLDFSKLSQTFFNYALTYHRGFPNVLNLKASKVLIKGARHRDSCVCPSSLPEQVGHELSPIPIAKGELSRFVGRKDMLWIFGLSY